MNLCPSYKELFQHFCCRLHFCGFFWDKREHVWHYQCWQIFEKNLLYVVGAETWYISLMYVHCISFRNELTNSSYMLSFGVNFRIHKRNLLTRPLAVALALCINSSSSFIVLCWIGAAWEQAFCLQALQKTLYLFGMITLTSFPPAFNASSAAAWVNSFLTSNPVVVFAVVLLVF